jgi:L-lactate dehydrogenase complex protein LldE
MKILLMVTCLGDVIRPSAGQATVSLLRRLGHSVAFPAAQTCCGQPLFNSGYAELARDQARHTIRVFAGDGPVVTPSGSCAAMVKTEFPHLLADDPTWYPRAVELAARTFELSDFLVNQLGITELGARYLGRVTYHYACHLRALAMLPATVESLLAKVEGLIYVPLTRLDQCCGFGGSFAVRYPHVSGAMVDDKMRCILQCGADTLVSTDTGCLMNIGGKLHRENRDIKVLHLAELLESR